MFGDAAKQQMRNPAASVRTHHDQVDAVISRILGDLLRCQPPDDGASSAEALLFFRIEAFQ